MIDLRMSQLGGSIVFHGDLGEIECLELARHAFPPILFGWGELAEFYVGMMFCFEADTAVYDA